MNKFINIETVFMVLKNIISSFANEISLQTAGVNYTPDESRMKFYKRVNESAFFKRLSPIICVIED